MKFTMWLKVEGKNGKAEYELECKNLGEPGVGIPIDVLQKLIPRILDDLARQSPVAPSRPAWGREKDKPVDEGVEPELLD